jgi:hypothetical protein
MTLHRFIYGFFLLFWTIPVSLHAESRLIFPRLVIQQGRFTGVAIANPTSSEARITLTAYNSDGSIFTGDGVSNPRTQIIAAGSQYVKLAWEILTPPASIRSSTTPRILWMEVTSTTDGLTGFFLEGDDSSQSLDGSDLSGSGADLLIPYVQNSGELTTELSLVNPDGSASVDVTIDFLNADGETMWSRTTTLAAHVALQGPISSLFSGSYANVSSVRVRSTAPLACLALLIRQPENSLIAVISRKGSAPMRTLYFPQLAQGGDWSTYLGLANLTSAQVLVTVTAYKKDGSLFSAPTVQQNPATCSLAAGGSLRTDVKSLFGFAEGALQEGWIKAEAAGPALTGYVEYGAGTNRALVSAQGEAVTQAYFSYQVNGSGYYTGIAVLNPSTIAANVEVVSMAASGTVLGKTRRALRPGQREAVLVEQWIPGAAGATSGSVYIKTDIPVIATQLFGTSTFTALANVPPQSAPADFDPGSAIPSLKVTPPLAVVETGKTLKFTSSGSTVSSWKVNEVEGGDSSSGTVSAAGLFAAPSLAPSQHTQTVAALSSSGDQTAAASVDVVQRESLISGLTLLTAVAYFDSLQRFFVAEQQLLASAPTGDRVYASSANTQISEVSSSGTSQPFKTVSGDTIVKMVPFTDGGGASHLLLAGTDTGTIYRLTLSNQQISTVQSGLSQPSSMALDPVSGDLLVSEAGASQITVIAKSKFDPTVSAAPSLAEQAGPAVQSIPVSPSPRGVAFDPCTGALYVTTSDGVLHEFLDNRERQVISGLNSPGQILVLMRRDFPSCFEAVTVFVAEPTRVVQIDPRAGEIISFLESVQDVRDLAFFPGDSPFAAGGEESVIVADGPVGVNLSRVVIVRVGRLYQKTPSDSLLQTGLEFSPAGDSIAYRDRRGDTFATAKSRQAGLGIPDIVGISIYRVGSADVVTVEFAKPVTAWSRRLPSSVLGWIDFDIQRGGGLPSHADPYEPLRPGLPEVDAYVDLSTGILTMVTAAPSIGSDAVSSSPTDGHAATTATQLTMGFLDNTLSVVIPTSYFDALKARVNVTAGNAAEITDIAPEARFAFVSRGTSSGPTVQFSASTSSGSESVTPASVEVTLSAASSSTVTVQYAVTGGSATGGGVDYTLAAGTLTFAPGETRKSIPITIIDDQAVEGSETIVLSLSNPVNATLGSPSAHTYTILDNDSTTPTVQFAYSSSGGPESVTTVNLNVVLSPASTETVTVQYAVTGGTATGGGSDYTLDPGTLSFSPGETSKNITMSVISDTTNEPDETVIVTLSNPTNAQLGTNSVDTYTIINDDGTTPTVQFASRASSGSESTTSVSLNVILSNAAAQTVTVQYAVSGGTATPVGAQGAGDYTLAPGTLSFAPGETSKDIPLSVVNDTIDETDETVIVTLSNPTNATLGAASSHTYTIIDDDNPPSVQFTSTGTSGSETVASVSIAVTLSSPSGKTVSVPYSVGGTATGGGVDYTLSSGTLTFNPGATSASLSLSITNDSLNEDNETVVVTLGTPTNATLGSPSAYTYTILDEDPLPVVQLSGPSPRGSESSSPVTLTVTLSPASGRTVTVPYSVGGTATGGGVDYSIGAGPVVFRPGETSRDIVISIVDDAVYEPTSETIVVTLTKPTNATLGASTTYTYSIIDNDTPPPSIQFAVDTGRGVEGDRVSVTVTLSAASSNPVSVSYTTGGTATAGSDYTISPATLSFKPGVTSLAFTLSIIVDTQKEVAETVVISLSNPVNGTLGSPSTYTFTIAGN